MRQRVRLFSKLPLPLRGWPFPQLLEQNEKLKEAFKWAQILLIHYEVMTKDAKRTPLTPITEGTIQEYKKALAALEAQKGKADDQKIEVFEKMKGDDVL